MGAALDIADLELTFNRGDINESRALRGFSLAVEPGEFVVLVGVNGEGDSTLLNVIAGVHHADSGHIRLGGADLGDLPDYRRARRIGRVHQDPMAGTAAALTVADNLALAATRGKRRRLHRPRGTAAWERELAQLKMGLDQRLGARVGALSGGQRQALSVLMALQADPELLLLDEHTAALDPGAAARILEVTDRLVRERGITTLMVTHNMTQALEFGDRTVFLHQGAALFELAGDERRRTTVADLIDRFHTLAHDALSDRAVLG